MEVVNTEIKKLAEEIYAKNTSKNPNNIKERIIAFIDRIRFHKQNTAYKNALKIIETFNMTNVCEFYKLNEFLYVGYYKGKHDLFLKMRLDYSDNELCTELAIMLPFIGSRTQIVNFTKSNEYGFWGAHLALGQYYVFDETVSDFEKMVKNSIDKALNICEKKYDFQTDFNFDFFVNERIHYLGLYPDEYNSWLADQIISFINEEKTTFHMPFDGQESRIEVIDSELQYKDLILTKLMNEKLVTTITEIAGYFIPSHIPEARKLAETALQLNDSEAEKILQWDEEEDDLLWHPKSMNMSYWKYELS